MKTMFAKIFGDEKCPIVREKCAYIPLRGKNSIHL